MEPYLADLINNGKVPRIIRYIIVCLLCGFIVYLGISTCVNSPYPWGKAFGAVLAAVSIYSGLLLIQRIRRS